MRFGQNVNKAVGRIAEELGFCISRVGFLTFIIVHKPDLRPKQIPLRCIPVALSISLPSLSQGKTSKFLVRAHLYRAFRNVFRDYKHL
jgi:hypothetical protein